MVLSDTAPAHTNEAHTFAKKTFAKNMFQTICVFLSKAELSELAPRRERCDMHEPPRLRTTFAGRRQYVGKDVLFIGIVLKGMRKSLFNQKLLEWPGKLCQALGEAPARFGLNLSPQGSI